MSAFVINPYRFGSTFSPADISGLQLWLDATTGLYDATTGGSPVTTDGSAVARWEDQSSNANHATQGTVNDRPLYRTNHDSLEFDGGTDSLNCGQPSSLDITGNGSIVFWCYLNSLIDFDGFVSKAVPGTGSIVGNSQYHVEMYLGKLRTIITGNDLRGGTETTGTAATVSTGVWQQFAFTWDGSDLKQYKNGSFAASRTQSGSPVTKAYDVFIGRRDRFFGTIDGKLGEVEIYDEAISSADITSLYDATKTKYGL